MTHLLTALTILWAAFWVQLSQTIWQANELHSVFSKMNADEQIPHLSKRIFGGLNYTNASNPNVIIEVTTKWNNKDSLTPCDGTLIEKDMVLTAAVCLVKPSANADPNNPYVPLVNYSDLTVEYYPSEKFRIRAGDFTWEGQDERGTTERRNVKELRHAVGYNWVVVGNDIAVLKLSSAVSVPKGMISPAPLCPGNAVKNQAATVMGFGMVLEPNGKTKVSDTLQYLSVEITAVGDECQKIVKRIIDSDNKLYGNWSFLGFYDNMICMEAVDKTPLPVPQSGAGPATSSSTSSGNGTTASGNNTSGANSTSGLGNNTTNSGAATGSSQNQTSQFNYKRTVCDYDIGGGVYFDDGGKLCTIGVLSPALICVSNVILATRASLEDYIYLFKPEQLTVPIDLEFLPNDSDTESPDDDGNDATLLSSSFVFIWMLILHAGLVGLFRHLDN